MRFFTAFALGALAALAAAADNPFTMATIPSTIPAGSSFSITWNPTTQGTVSLYLVNGPSSNVKFVSVIAANLTNSGAFTWIPLDSIVNGPNYAIEIVDDSNPSDVNYSGQFAISSSTNSAAVSPTSSISSIVSGTSTAGSSSSPASSATSSSASSESSHASSKSPSSSAPASSGSSPAPSSAPTSTGSGSNVTSILTVPSKTLTSLPTGTSSSSNTATVSKAAAAEQVAPVGMGLLAILGAALLAL